VEQGRLILRDGSTAVVRVAQKEDGEALRAFFKHLSPEARRRRFFSASLPSPELITALSDSSDPYAALTLIVTRTWEGESRIVATGSYLAKNERTAEVAFAVDDAFQGKGIGTLLLERLALLAVQNGFTRFWAVTQADNRGMREVFRESGFAVHERLEGSEIEVDLSVVPSEASVARTEMRERLATTASLRPFFRPKSVAVVGASRDPTSIGYRILEALVLNNFQGPVYPVNLHASVVGCIRAYPSVRDLPESVDLAIVAVPREAAPQVVDDCAARGVRALVVITAGYAEVGADGRQLQQQLVEKVRGYGMRMIGPNCFGLLNTDPAVQLNASFSPVFPPPGRIAMSSQSGALGLAVLAAAHRYGLGLSTFVSVGNKADVSSNDLLQYWEEDHNTDVILLYLESFGNPRRFARIARRVSRRKPIVALKAGRSRAGGRAAGSHTAALAANDIAVDALFHQTGVIRVERLEELFDLAALLSSQPLPRGRRVAIVTNAGGPAILCTDACEAGGLHVPELSTETKNQLATYLPAAANVSNPVDMIASAGAEHYRHAVETVLHSGEVDSLIVMYIAVGLEQTQGVAGAVLDAVSKARAKGRKDIPVLACLMTEQAVRMQLIRDEERIPTFSLPEAAARALSKAATYADWLRQPLGTVPEFDDMDVPSARAVVAKAIANGSRWLSPEETGALLRASRLPIVSGGIAKTVEEAAALARTVGFPVAVKLASQRLVHKSEVGGVHLHLQDETAVRRACQQIRDRLAKDGLPDAMEGILVQPMVNEGVEVMVGMTYDPLFGPLIAFGLGGMHVEILADVCFRATPLTDRDAAEMVQAIRGYRLLKGYRGHPPADVEAIEQLLLRVSRLVEEIPEIRELDLNPVFALAPGQGCLIADARVRVEAGREPVLVR
jgi:acetyl coenzyme A synthetase (ADP forming)-like protein